MVRDVSIFTVTQGPSERWWSVLGYLAGGLVPCDSPDTPPTPANSRVSCDLEFSPQGR